jgi:hypothetical protein
VLKEKPGFPLRSAAGMTLYRVIAWIILLACFLKLGKRKTGPVGPKKKGEQAWRFMI